MRWWLRSAPRVDATSLWLALVAFCAYAPGVWWGLPHATSEAGKHGWDVDGIGGIVTLSELHNFFVEAKPDWYVVYPPFHYLLLGVVYLPYLGWLWLTGGFSNPSAEFPYGFTNPVTAVATLALISRLVTLAMAVATVVVAYATARLAWDRRTGILAALAALLAQPMFYYGRTSNLDVPALFWLALSFWMAAKMLASGATVRRGAWLGAFVALAVATKDQAYGPWTLASLALPMLCYRQAQRQNTPWSWRPWLATLVSATGVYVVAGAVLLSPDRFAAHVEFLVTFKEASPIARQMPDVLRPYSPDGLLALARGNAEAVADAMGPVLPLMGLAGFVLFRKSALVQLIAVAVVGFVVFVLVPVQHVQYRYVMFPVYALAFPAARALVWCLEQPRLARTLAAGVCLLAGLHLGARGLDLTYQMIFDARRDAGAWLAVHAVPGSRLAYFGLVDQLPRLPAGTAVHLTSPDASVETQWSPDPPHFVLVIPDFSSEPGMPRSRFLTQGVYERLQDGSLGYRPAARFATRPLFGQSLKYLPYVNSPVEIYTRIDGLAGPGVAAPRPPAGR